MTLNAKQLLVIAFALMGVQFLLLPVIVWQNEQVATIERDLDAIASRESLISSLPAMQREVVRRDEAIATLRAAGFTRSPTASLEMQRWVSLSLKNGRVSVDNFEWAPQALGPVTTSRAKVGVRGRSKDLLEWIAMIRAEESWVSVLALKLRHADPRKMSRDTFVGNVTLEFVLVEEDRD